MSPRITIDGREYEGPEAMPPDVRRAYQEVMEHARPALEDRDWNGVPDVVEDRPGSTRPAGLVIENRIVVNGQSYRGPDEMPAETRALYDQAMSQVRSGAGVRITRDEPGISIAFSLGERRPLGAPRSIEPSAIESSLRTVLVVVALAVFGGLAAWAMLGR